MNKSKLHINNQDYIYIGRVAKLHGVKGAFSVHLMNAQDSVLKKGSQIYLQKADDSSVSGLRSIRSIQHTPKKSIMCLEGIEDAQSAESILPFEIWFARCDFPELKEGYYLCDLIDMQVYDGDNYLGKISSFYSNGAQDVVVISDQGSVVLELPLIDHFVKEIQWVENKVIVSAPEEI